MLCVLNQGDMLYISVYSWTLLACDKFWTLKLSPSFEFTAVYDERKSMETEKKKLQKQAKEQEESKPQGPTVTAESLGVGIDGDDGGLGSKKTGNQVDKASDDFFFEKFKNRTQDSWRYQ